MNTQRRIRKLGLILFVGAMLSACSSVPVQIGPQGDEKYDVTRPHQISAQACGFQLFLFIPIAANSRVERAYRELKEKAQGDYIADVKIREEWTYAFVGTLYCSALEATAYPRVKT